MLFQCFAALKVYGKQPEELAAVNAMFQLVLSDYAMADIRKAFGVYLRRHNDLPAPADIVQIIERDGKPPLDRAVYVAVSKKQPEDRSDTDWSYMREYERYAKTGQWR